MKILCPFPARPNSTSGISSVLHERDQGPITQSLKEEAKVWNLHLARRSAGNRHQSMRQVQMTQKLGASVGAVGLTQGKASFRDHSLLL